MLKIDERWLWSWPLVLEGPGGSWRSRTDRETFLHGLASRDDKLISLGFLSETEVLVSWTLLAWHSGKKEKWVRWDLRLIKSLHTGPRTCTLSIMASWPRAGWETPPPSVLSWVGKRKGMRKRISIGWAECRSSTLIYMKIVFTRFSASLIAGNLCIYAWTCACLPHKEFTSRVVCINMVLQPSSYHIRFAWLVHTDCVRTCVYPLHYSYVTAALIEFHKTFYTLIHCHLLVAWWSSNKHLLIPSHSFPQGGHGMAS